MVSIIEKDIKPKSANNNKISIIFIISFCILHNVLFVNNAETKAWRQKGTGIFITSYEMRSFRGINSGFNYDNDIRYTQGVLNLYGEYGITNRIAMIGKIIAIDSMLMHGNWFLGKVNERSVGIDAIQMLTKIGIINNNEIIALFFITGLGTPSFYHQNKASQFAIRKYSQISGIEFDLKIDKKSLLSLTAYYHYNIKHWYNELRLEAMYYRYFLKNLLFIVKFQKFIYQIHNKTEAQNDWQSANTSVYTFFANGGFAKIVFSFGTPISNNLMLEIGFYSSIKSKFLKTKSLDLKMRGIFLSLWYNF